ncbi:Coiled-coil domain-containing protein 106 [Merluccius polli]|uniref:Coiled-coil domain-containing protein 106 n=1 Tax=Merluccius polli TaxID=89951 RepID=A0AA47NR74_MERPO|nr:Coiled-coil domain-containing protein 106 [Merluccius polli]
MIKGVSGQMCRLHQQRGWSFRDPTSFFACHSDMLSGERRKKMSKRMSNEHGLGQGALEWVRPEIGARALESVAVPAASGELSLALENPGLGRSGWGAKRGWAWPRLGEQLPSPPIVLPCSVRGHPRRVCTLALAWRGLSEGSPLPGVEGGCGDFGLGWRSAALDVCRALLADLLSYGDCSGSTRGRAHGPDEVIARYRKVLKAYKKKNSITAACRIVGVDRNTIALNAPIAELSIAAPEKFAEFKDQHTTKHKLGDFAGKCRDAIRDCPDIDDTVRALKKSGKLLPVGKGDF